MPIPCVDLIVVNNGGDVLLAKRTNEPAKDEWWFPGGRVHYLETRLGAAIRKLREECGLETGPLFELATYDVIVERSDNGVKSHAITTLYYTKVSLQQEFMLDFQSSMAEWHSPLEWLKLDLNPFIQIGLNTYINYKGEKESRS